MNPVSIITGLGIILLVLGALSLCLFPHQCDPEDWDIGPPCNAFEIAMFVSGFLFIILGLSLAYLSPLCSRIPNNNPRKVELVIPGDAQMNAEIIREDTRIHLKDL